MFSSNHEIWKFAYTHDELDDWLPYAEDLIRMWSIKNKGEVKFQNSFEIIIAAYLLKDDLLPVSAKVAFATSMLEAVNDATNAKIHFKSLHILPPKPGRKEHRTETFIRCREVRILVEGGSTATDAYRVVAEKYFKSPDTIRRDYERNVLNARKKKISGKDD